MIAEKVWRWWDAPPTSYLLKEASAQEFMLRLVDYIKELFEITDNHPPVGFVLKPDGSVCLVPDLEYFPPAMWGPALTMIVAEQQAEFYAIVCEAAIAKVSTEKEAREALQSLASVKELKGAREGMLLTLRALGENTLGMFFLPRLEGNKLGEVETPDMHVVAN